MSSRLNISQQRYNSLLFEIGEEYFQWRCDGFEKVLQAFRYSREMWSWWKYQYLIIDEQLLLDKTPITFEIYRLQHLGLEYWPNSAIVDKALADYDKVVQNLIKSEINNTHNLIFK